MHLFVTQLTLTLTENINTKSFNISIFCTVSDEGKRKLQTHLKWKQKINDFDINKYAICCSAMLYCRIVNNESTSINLCSSDKHCKQNLEIFIQTRLLTPIEQHIVVCNNIVQSFPDC